MHFSGLSLVLRLKGVPQEKGVDRRVEYGSGHSQRAVATLCYTNKDILLLLKWLYISAMGMMFQVDPVYEAPFSRVGRHAGIR